MKKILISSGFIFLALTGCSMLSRPTSLVDDITKKAINLKDKALCESLTRDEDKNFCITSITDSQTVDSVIATGDAGLCEKIENNEYKEACKRAATSRQRSLENDKVQREKLTDAQNGTSLEACNSLEDSSAKEQCVTNVSSSTAFAQKNPKLCDPIKNPTIKDMCIAQAKE